MSTLDGDQAIAWMRAKGINVPGSCLNTCWQAYGSYPSIGAHRGQYPDAIDGWNYATKRHPGDMNPPAGFPVWFGVSPTRTDADAGAGDVVISLGGGQVIATDANGVGGRIGVTTIAARAARIQRPYLGWTEDFLGYDVVTTSTASLGAPVPITTKPIEDDMAAAVLLRDTKGGIWLAPDDGDLVALDNLDEVNALVATGAVRQITNPDGSRSNWIQLSDGLILGKRQAIASRKHAAIASGK